MLDENVWMQLSEDEKFLELQNYLNLLLNINNGAHSLSKTSKQGRLAVEAKELQEKIFKIIEIENPL
jgi:hypothetical protein